MAKRGGLVRRCPKAEEEGGLYGGKASLRDSHRFQLGNRKTKAKFLREQEDIKQYSLEITGTLGERNTQGTKRCVEL